MSILTPTIRGNRLAVPLFACMRCHKASAQAGRGYRMLLGARVQVCRACKDAIDAQRAREAR